MNRLHSQRRYRDAAWLCYTLTTVGRWGSAVEYRRILWLLKMRLRDCTKAVPFNRALGDIGPRRTIVAVRQQ